VSYSLIKRIVCFALALAVIFLGFMYILTTVFPLRYTDIIREYSIKYNLKQEMVYAVIHTESRFRPEARSPASAAGLMQLMPETAAWAAERMGMTDYNAANITAPRVNIELGCWYLSWLHGHFDGEADTALAAYNAGQGRVAQWLRDAELSSDGRTLDYIPYNETRNYVNRVNTAMPIYRLLLVVFGRFLP
jgi:soluble lytic murein transglycosylase